MELEEGKIYTTQQMQKFMGISKSTWDHRRDELLENFCLYYEYEVIYEGRSTKYHILRKLGDYQKPLSKRSKELRDQIYERRIRRGSRERLSLHFSIFLLVFKQVCGLAVQKFTDFRDVL